MSHQTYAHLNVYYVIYIYVQEYPRGASTPLVYRSMYPLCTAPLGPLHCTPSVGSSLSPLACSRVGFEPGSKIGVGEVPNCAKCSKCLRNWLFSYAWRRCCRGRFNHSHSHWGKRAMATLSGFCSMNYNEMVGPSWASYQKNLSWANHNIHIFLVSFIDLGTMGSKLHRVCSSIRHEFETVQNEFSQPPFVKELSKVFTKTSSKFLVAGSGTISNALLEAKRPGSFSQCPGDFTRDRKQSHT